MFMPRTRFMETFAPKWGDESSRYSWQLEKVYLGMLISIFMLLPVAAALIGTGARIAGVACIVGLLALHILSFPVIVSIAKRRDEAASRTLGFVVNGRPGNFPPKNSPQYEKWCEEKGLLPYAASGSYTRGPQLS
jgi:hypothetical protein